jgi:putative ABC transport system permease protein
MLKNYLKIAVRNILQHKLYTFTNVFSFSVGLAALIVAGLYLLNEFSYDTFQNKSKQIYRIASVYQKDSTLLESALTPYRLGQSLQKDYPELINTQCRLMNFQNPSILIEYKTNITMKKIFLLPILLYSIYSILTFY